MVSKYMPIPKKEIYGIIERAQKGDEDARARLITENTGLVKMVAMKFISEDCELEDLTQIGYIGLLRAVEKFNPEYDVMFSTYAVPMILGEIKRYFRDHGKIKVSRALKADLYTLRQTQTSFEIRNGRMPRISEIAEGMGVTRERVLELMEAEKNLRDITSLDQNPEAYGNTDGRIGYAGDVQVDRILLKDEIAALEEKERLVILLRYYRDMTQQQIADRLGVSQVQISRIEKKALRKIREKMDEK